MRHPVRAGPALNRWDDGALRSRARLPPLSVLPCQAMPSIHRRKGPGSPNPGHFGKRAESPPEPPDVPSSRSAAASLTEFADVDRLLAEHGVEINPDWSDIERYQRLARITCLKENGVSDSVAEQAKAMSNDSRTKPERAAALAARRGCQVREAIAAVVAPA